MADDKDFESDYWVRHRERALEHKWYSIGRMDVLLISISAGGLYTCYEVVKFIYEQKLCKEFGLLKVAAFGFALALFANFLSQLFATYAHSNESKWSRVQIDRARGKTISEADQMKQIKSDKLKERFDTCVEITNWIALIAMVVGIVLMAIVLSSF